MKYVIVGAVAGGASAAARLRRLDEKAEIILFEKGEYISYANCGLPYYIGNVIKKRDALFVQTANAFNKRFNIDVRVKTEVIAIHPETKTVIVKNQNTQEEYQESYDKLILSPGAEPIKPPLPGITHEGIFTLRNVNDTDYIKSFVQQSNVKRAVVIGAGFIGLEMAENLHHIGLNVSIIEMAKQVLAPVDYTIAAILQKHIRSKGVNLLLNVAVTSFEKTNSGIKVNLNNGEFIETDLVILSIGVKPDSHLATAAGLKIGATKGIWVNEYLQTSNPDIYAVGDAIEFPHPISKQATITYLAGPANKQGRICANNIVLGNKHKYNGSINTAIVKVFDLTVATTGIASKHLKILNIKHLTSITHSGSHAGYYPGANQMTIQLAYSPENGKILGTQIIGVSGVDKRIDVFASAIKNNHSIYELTEFEHAYAPPFSSAKDPVNIAAFAAENVLTEKARLVNWDEFQNLQADTYILDVRTEAETSTGIIPKSINIPIDELRKRINEIPKNKKILIYCAAGLRGYLAQRILLQNDYKLVFNLSGGYQTWLVCTEEENYLKKNKIETV
ncbi:MAG: FAD-dependent oxidoreductase [Bacteroidetes bacterium]|nr:FAD-dependent oxidoreductase [Bacteroidota bacterium]